MRLVRALPLVGRRRTLVALASLTTLVGLTLMPLAAQAAVTSSVPRLSHAASAGLRAISLSEAVPVPSATWTVDLDAMTRGERFAAATLTHPLGVSPGSKTGGDARADPLVWLLGLGVPLGGVLLYLVLFFTLGRGYRVDVRRRRSMDIPADLPPAVVTVLWDERSVTTRGFAATVLDLVRQGVVAVAGLGGEDPLGAATTGLRPGSGPKPPVGTHERVAYELLLEAAGDDELASGAELRRYLRRHPHVAHDRMIEFYAAVMSEGGRGLREHLSPRASFALRVAGVFTVLAGTFATARSGWPPCVLGAVTGGAMIVFARWATLRPSPQAVALYRRYREVRRYLVDIGRMGDKQASSVILWERYLVLAVVFGIAHKVQRSLRVDFTAPDFAAVPPTLNWFGSEGQAYGLALDGFDPAWRD